MNVIFIYTDNNRETFKNIRNFEEKKEGVSFYNNVNDYWFIRYNAFDAFILTEENKNDT
jgi:hypothetical protein